MTREELALNDGQDGRRAYIAVNGTVYDVTDSPRWENGHHPPDHRAGQDLTLELQSAPHIKAVVERFPVVGKLTEPETTRSSGGLSGPVIGVIVAVLLVIVALVLAL